MTAVAHSVVLRYVTLRACPACKATTPEVRKFHESRRGAVRVQQLDANELNGTWAPEYVPAFALGVDGKLIATRTGYITASALARWVDAGVRRAGAVNRRRA